MKPRLALLVLVRQSYAPGFRQPLVFKDVRLALAEAENAGAATTWCETGSSQESLAAMQISTGTALGLIAAEEAGLDVNP